MFHSNKLCLAKRSYPQEKEKVFGISQVFPEDLFGLYPPPPPPARTYINTKFNGVQGWRTTWDLRREGLY